MSFLHRSNIYILNRIRTEAYAYLVLLQFLFGALRVKTIICLQNEPAYFIFVCQRQIHIKRLEIMKTDLNHMIFINLQHKSQKANPVKIRQKTKIE